MDQIILHIEKLLINNDHVVVPGLGGFVLQHESAKVLSGYILPPVATIGFNPLMNHQDGVLAVTLSRSMQITYKSAIQHIEDKIREMIFSLKNNNQYAFGRLGTFRMTESGNINFEPTPNVEFLPDNLGKNKIALVQSQHLNVSRKNQHSWVKYAAAVILIIGLFATGNRVDDKQQVNSADFGSIAMTLVQKSINSTNTADTIQTVNSNLNFHVVVAGFTTLRKAENYCNELKSGNFSDCKVIPGIKTQKVCVASFSTETEAMQFANQLHLSGKQFKDAWVLHN